LPELLHGGTATGSPSVSPQGAQEGGFLASGWAGALAHDPSPAAPPPRSAGSRLTVWESTTTNF